MWWKEHNYESSNLGSNLSSISLSFNKHILNSYGPGLVLGTRNTVVMKTHEPYSSWHVLMDAYLLRPLPSCMMLGLSLGLSELQLRVMRVK